MIVICIVIITIFGDFATFFVFVAKM